MTDNVNIHELVNSKGFGSSEIALKKAGLWDECNGLPEREYHMKVSYEIRDDEIEYVTVTARCEEEAQRKAMKKVEDGCDYNIDEIDAQVAL